MSAYYHVSTSCAYMSGKVYMIACVCVCGVVRLHAHTAKQTLTVRMQTNPERFSRPRAEPSGPWDRAPCCPPGSCQGKVLPCATAWESCWGAYVGCDTWLHRHTCTWPCIYTNNNPPYPPTHTHTHTKPPGYNHLHTNLHACEPHCAHIHAHTHIQRPAHSHLDLQLDKSPFPQQHILPAPSAAEPTIP